MKALLDTDIIVDFLRTKEKSKNLIKDVSDDKITAYISVLTEAEILSGDECNTKERMAIADELLSLFKKIEVNSELARKGADFRRTHKIPLTDAIIAATAIKLSVPIYSRNTKHFGKITEIKIEAPY